MRGSTWVWGRRAGRREGFAHYGPTPQRMVLSPCRSTDDRMDVGCHGCRSMPRATVTRTSDARVTTTDISAPVAPFPCEPTLSSAIVILGCSSLDSIALSPRTSPACGASASASSSTRRASTGATATPSISCSARASTCATLFGPQHGLWGHTQDNMVEWEGGRYRGLSASQPLRRAPRADAPRCSIGLDRVVIDVFDVGSRYYTFVWSMALTIRACARAGIPVTVLDRPNPVDGVDDRGADPWRRATRASWAASPASRSATG